MKITSAVITFITAATVVWGATLKSREHQGANQTSRAGTRAHAGKRAAAATCAGSSSGFHPPGQPSCVCNFAGACDPSTNAHTPAAAADLTNLVGIAPQKIDALAYGTKNVGTVCEDGVVATLYDCNARTSLYAATVIGSATGAGVRKDCWKTTTDVKLIKHQNVLPTHDDYQDSSKHIYCFENAGKEFEWDGVTTCTTKSPTKMPIHKGHLIAARYGKAHGNMDATFTYTNAVPQVGGFNSGKWRTHEAKVSKLAADCQKNAPAGINIKVYIVVGVVPSTFLGKPRFFGAAGFGGFQGFSKLHGKTTLEYRISFPEIMWTAACCVHSDGTVHEKLAFWRRNWPDRSDPVSLSSSALPMFMDMQTEIKSTWGKAFVIPTVFPGKAGCD